MRYIVVLCVECGDTLVYDAPGLDECVLNTQFHLTTHLTAERERERERERDEISFLSTLQFALFLSLLN